MLLLHLVVLFELLRRRYGNTIGCSEMTCPDIEISLTFFLWQESKLKAARMHIYVRRGGPNYQKGLAKMRSLGEEIGIPIEVCTKC